MVREKIKDGVFRGVVGSKEHFDILIKTGELCDINIFTMARVNWVDVVYKAEKKWEVSKAIENSELGKYREITTEDLVDGWMVTRIRKNVNILFDSMDIEKQLDLQGIEYKRQQIIYQGK